MATSEFKHKKGKYHIHVVLMNDKELDLAYTCPINGVKDEDLPMWYFDNLTSQFKNEIQLKMKMQKDTKLKIKNMYLENLLNKYHPMVFDSELIKKISNDLIKENYPTDIKTREYFKDLKRERELLAETIVSYSDLYPNISLMSYPFYLRKIINVMREKITDPDVYFDHDTALRDATKLAYQRIDKYSSFRDTYNQVKVMEEIIVRRYNPNLITYDKKIDKILNPAPILEPISETYLNSHGQDSEVLDNSYALEEKDDYGYRIHT